MTHGTRRRLLDRKIIELLMRGKGINAIGVTLHVSKRRIRALREKARARGYLSNGGGPGGVALPPYPEGLFPDIVDGRSDRESETDKLLEGRKEWIRERLAGGWHAVTVYEELRNNQVSRSSFYRYLDRHGLCPEGENPRVIVEIVHRPGEALLLDWGKLRDVADPTTGKKKTLWMFAGILGYSRYLMVRLVWTMDLATTLTALEGFLRHMGGVPGRMTTDNPKCFALTASPYEPLLNPALERFAAHYGLTVECLPPRDPQKKGKIERVIPFLRRLYEAHGDAWEGLDESQTYMDGKLAIANQRQHGTTRKRPLDLLAEERRVLKPLPATAYTVEEFHEGLVRQDSHVRFDHKYYSVDDQYCGKSVVVLGSPRQVSIYHAGRLLEVHDRLTDPLKSKSTKPHHLKPWERDLSSGDGYRQRAQALGPQVDVMIEKILAQGDGFIDLRKVWGILSLDKRYSASRIDGACGRALVIGQLGYQAVKRWLDWEDAVMARPAHARDESADAPSPVENKYARPLSVYREQVELIPKEVTS